MSAVLLADNATLNVMFEVWNQMKSDPKAQFTWHGKTTRHFQPRQVTYQGELWHFNMYVEPSTAARMNTMSAVRASGYELPAGRPFLNQRCSYNYDDLRVLETTVEINEWADEFTKDPIMALWKVGDHLMTDAKRHFMERTNVAVHQDTTATLAKVASDAYKLTDGTAATTQTEVYIPIDEGSLARFKPGMAIDFRNASNPASIRVSAYVKSISPDGLGPRLAGGTAGRIAAFADTVGIVADYDATLNTASGGTATDFSTITDGDEIVLHLEGDVGIWGLPSFWDNTINPYYDKDHSAIDRDDGLHEYLFPNEIDKTSGGANTNIDMEDHFDELADFLPDVVATGRQKRMSDQGGSSPKEGIFWKEHLLAIGRQDLVNDAAKDGQSTIQFTSMAESGLSDAEKKMLIGVVGFDGTVYRSPTLGTIALESDPVCSPNLLYILDPNSWFTLTRKGGMFNMNWIKNPAGGIFHRVAGTNGRPTYALNASANTVFQLSCDQPMANARIKGIKSSRKAS